MAQNRLQLTWYNKDKALIPTEEGKYGYTWVDPSDPRYCETHTLIFDEYISGSQSPKFDKYNYTDIADLPPQCDNLLILGESGDVLESLTRVPELSSKYVGKVKMIYIDPPFNTAKAFQAYEDNLEHSVWLTMMRDRLLHLKKLLSNDGTIWLHIDDIEVHRIRLLMDEIFGPTNFLSEIAWEKTYKPRNDKKEQEGFSSRHDMILVYSKSQNVKWNRLNRTAAMDSAYDNPDNDPLGAWTSTSVTANKGDGKGGMCYCVQNPLSGEMIRPLKRSWSIGQEELLAYMNEWAPYKLEDLHDEAIRANNDGISIEKVKTGVRSIVLDCSIDEARKSVERRWHSGVWPKVYVTSKGGIRQKSYLYSKKGKIPEDMWFYSEVGSNDEAKNEIKALFPDEVPFDTPKPERLLQRIIHIATNPGDIVLDCFAGSGTTAAVAQKMGRRWITCELVESSFNRFTRPRLEMVINDRDPGGITSCERERIAAKDVELPDGVSPEDAAMFNSVLKKIIDEDENLKTDGVIKLLKQKTKTELSKKMINWRGGGGFQIAHLSPACYDYDSNLGCVILTQAATGNILVSSVAANLGFRLIKNEDKTVFDARRGKSLLKVIEGIVTEDIIDWLVPQLSSNESLVIAATSIPDGVREYLRKHNRGSRILSIPYDLFNCRNHAD